MNDGTKTNEIGNQNTNDILVRIALNASLSEIRTWPKPGNVHKTRDFPNTSYENFLTAGYNLKEDWKLVLKSLKQAQNIISFESETNIHSFDFSQYSNIYSQFLETSVQNMMSSQRGGNVLLGHLMLLGPLFISSAVLVGKEKLDNLDNLNNLDKPNKNEFWDFNKKILSESNTENTIQLYKALRIAQPGGMGSLNRYDIFSETAFDEIQEDNMNLQKIFEISRDYDSISNELSTNYSLIRFDILPKIEKLIDEYHGLLDSFFRKIPKKLIRKDIIEISPKFNEFVLRVFLYILSIQTDTLIARKNNISTAEKISNKSQRLFEKYYEIDPSIWFEEVISFDEELQKEEGKLNPGTTADLLAASLYVKYIYNYFEF